MLRNGSAQKSLKLIVVFKNSTGAESNYNNQFLYISAIAFNKTHIHITEYVLSI